MAVPGLCPHEESQFPPTSPWGPLRSASGSNPSSIWITAYALGLRVCEISYALFNDRTSVSCTPLALLYKSSYWFQSQVSFLFNITRLVSPGWAPGTLRRISAMVHILLFMCCLLYWILIILGCRSWLYQIFVPPTILLCFFFESLVVENLF